MQQTEWAPKTAALIGCAALGILLAAAAVTQVTDAPGRLLAGIAGVGLLIFAGFSYRARPRLAITPDGLVVRGWWRTHTLRKPDIKLIRITEFRRIGRKVRLLEIDTNDDQLLVLSRWDLGANPLTVLDALTEAGYAGRRNSD
ncbi:PH domain-containing protein [Mycobacterium sp.]|uniref:PH domain-containing protein n=1 Tax=Mycobacterium sp. TaxID=1785 RepID=UPI002D6CB457|nr:PH domain-containing protein [Mycobacterium sp.]HZA11798.1 PH domain-containing protein [Mycobacterium sp.]